MRTATLLLLLLLGLSARSQFGTLDASFTPGNGPNFAPAQLARQSTGKILLAGFFDTYNGTTRKWIARLDATGSLDAGFNPGAALDDAVYVLRVQPDDKILLAGTFTSFNGIPRGRLLRLNADGTLDNGFLATGSGSNGLIRAITLQPDGKILIGGSFTSFNGVACKDIVRLNADGSVDGSFSAPYYSEIHAIALQPDGRILISGEFNTAGGSIRNVLARLHPDGSIDPTFDNGENQLSNYYFNSLLVQPDGKILGGGILYNQNRALVRFLPNGRPDTSFHSGSGPNDWVTSLLLLPNGNILAGGNFTSYNGTPVNRIAYLRPDGRLDPAYSGSGPDNNVTALLALPDSKVLVAGDFGNFHGVARKRLAQLSAPTAPALVMGAAPAASFCSGTGLNVSFSTYGTFNAGNVFTAQLSNASGSFASPVTIGSVAGTGGQTSIAATIPAAALTGGRYRIRVVSSDPALVSTDNGLDLAVNNLPAVVAPANSSVCNGNTVPALSFGASSSYNTWSNDRPDIGLPAGGAGVLPPFTAVNSGNTPVTATITIRPAVPYAYVPNYSSATVSVINLATRTVVHTIGVADRPYSITYSPSGHRVFVAHANNSRNIVTVINGADGSVLRTLPVPKNPRGMALTRDGGRLFVAGGDSNSVAVIDPETGGRLRTIPVDPNPFALSEPFALLLNADESLLYVADRVQWKLYVISTSTYQVAQVVSLDPNAYPIDMALSPDGSRLYVLNQENNTVSVVSTATHTLTGNFATGVRPWGIVVSPDGKRAYVSNENSSTVTVHNLENLSLVTSIPVAAVPYGISITPDGSQVLVSNAGANFVTAIRTANNSIADTLRVENTPYAYGSFISPAVACAGPASSFTIKVNPTPTASFSYANGPFCPHGTAPVPTFTGTSGGSFSAPAGLGINSGSGQLQLANTPAGSYTVTYALPASGGCPALSASSNVTVLAAPPQPVISASGSSLQSSAATGNQWYLDGTLLAGQTGASITPTQSGMYTVATTANGCSSLASAPFNYVISAVGTLTLGGGFAAFPSPAGRVLQVRSASSETFVVTVSDLSGRIVLAPVRVNGTARLDVAPFAPGTYLLLVRSVRTGKTYRQLFLKS